MNELIIRDLGSVPYSEAYQYQNKLFTDLVKKKINGDKTPGTLLFCEHPNVYTIGKSGDKRNLLVNAQKLKELNVDFFPVDRGGDITYHGPGQIVMYPIIDLDNYKASVKEYIYLLEFTIIEVLKNYGISGEVSNGNIGVWLDVEKEKERKICSIGVKVSRKITMHGLALNANTDLSFFDYINPCGFTEKRMTSIQKELSHEADVNEMKLKIKNSFIKRINEI